MAQDRSIGSSGAVGRSAILRDRLKSGTAFGAGGADPLVTLSDVVTVLSVSSSTAVILGAIFIVL